MIPRTEKYFLTIKISGKLSKKLKKDHLKIGPTVGSIIGAFIGDAMGSYLKYLEFSMKIALHRFGGRDGIVYE